MAAFGPLFTGISNAGGWAFDDPKTNTTTIYSQHLPYNQPNFNYLNTNHDYNYFPNANQHHLSCPNSDLDHHFTCVDDSSLIVPMEYKYNPMILPSPAPQLSPTGDQTHFSINSDANVAETMTAEKKRKMYHNASERDRRKKINSLYSTLRAVLPANDQKKKLSNPDTVARAVKYIPELQKKVDVLTQTKKLLLTNTTPSIYETSSYSVQAMQLGDGEISVQISSLKSVDNAISSIPISEVMRELEEENGLSVMEVSSSQSTAGRVSYYIHVKVDATYEVKCETLREKILKSCQNWDRDQYNKLVF